MKDKPGKSKAMVDGEKAVVRQLKNTIRMEQHLNARHEVKIEQLNEDYLYLGKKNKYLHVSVDELKSTINVNKSDILLLKFFLVFTPIASSLITFMVVH